MPSPKQPLIYFSSLELENVRCFGERQTLELTDGKGRAGSMDFTPGGQWGRQDNSPAMLGMDETRSGRRSERELSNPP